MEAILSDIFTHLLILLAGATNRDSTVSIANRNFIKSGLLCLK